MKRGRKLRYRDLPVITAEPREDLEDVPPELILQTFEYLDYVSIKRFCDSSSRLRRICQSDIFTSLIESKKADYIKETEGYPIVALGSFTPSIYSYHLTDDEMYESTIELIVEFDKLPTKYWKLEEYGDYYEEGWFGVDLKPNFPPRAKYDEIYDELLNIIALVRKFGFTIKGKVLLFSLDPENAEVFEINSSNIGGYLTFGFGVIEKRVKIKDMRRLYGTFVPQERGLDWARPSDEFKSIGEFQVEIPEKYERDEAAWRNKSRELTAMETAIDDLLAGDWKVTIGDGGATIKVDELMEVSPVTVYPQLKRIVEIFIQNDFEVVGKVMVGWKTGIISHLEKYEINTPEGVPLQKSVPFFKSEYDVYSNMPPFFRGRIQGKSGIYRRIMEGRARESIDIVDDDGDSDNEDTDEDEHTS